MYVCTTCPSPHMFCTVYVCMYICMCITGTVSSWYVRMRMLKNREYNYCLYFAMHLLHSTAHNSNTVMVYTHAYA